MKARKEKIIELATVGNNVSFVTIGLGMTSDPNDQELEVRPSKRPLRSKGQ